MATHHSIAVHKTAHYYTIGTPGPTIRQFWIVCHGYAQLADEFLKEFDLLDNPHTFVVAPEGFNLFYRKGFTGLVGANWMTRQHRESAIADYSSFIQQIYDYYTPQLPADVRIVLLGFSQGSTTVTRWVMHNQPYFHDLVLWAGLPPDDIDYASHRNYLSDKNLYLLYGSDDPFLTPDRLTSVQDIEDKNGIDFQEETFVGGHEIPVDILQQFINRLN
jgi:predicted esterase